MNIHPRVMATDPWTSADDALNALIDKIILDKYPTLDDNKIVDVLDNKSNREEAMHTIITKILKMKG